MAGWFALIPAALSMVQQMAKQGADQQQAAGQQALSMENLLFQKELANRQYELATAGRTNVRGDKTLYVPGKGWMQFAGPETATQMSLDDDLMKKEMIRQLSIGESERNRGASRRANEGAAAESLLSEFDQGYGLPTREGVRGKVKVARATQATEGADKMRNALSSAALRQGTTASTPMGINLDALGRQGTMGLRSALAQADVDADPMFDAMYKSAVSSKLDPYSSLSASAGGVPGVKPNSAGDDLTASLSNAAAIGAMRGGGGGADVGKAFAQAGASYPGYVQGPQWDMFASGVAGVLERMMKKSSFTGPTYVDTEYHGRNSDGNTWG